MPSEVKKLRQLEEENVKIKRLVADLPLDQGSPPAGSRRRPMSRVQAAWTGCFRPVCR